MPALVVDTDPRPASASTSSTPSAARDRKRSESRSPDRPPVSPITPTSSAAQLAPVEPADPQARVAPPPPAPAATFIHQPPSVPISESENPDAIALRSAISLLQLQREKSKRDLKTLQELKSTAVADPQAFARSLQTQQRARASKPADILTPTLSHDPEPERDEDGEGHAGEEQQQQQQQSTGDARKDSGAVDGDMPGPECSSKFPTIPQPQNIVRCPPVNWAKYHIVGEPLDKMHREQRQYPGAAEPPKTQSGRRAPPHAIAAPYSPFTDNVGDSQPTPQAWRSFKKSPS